jgi:hypothetical protein
MSSPNSDLGVLPMTLIAVVAVGTLVFWLVAVYLAARPPRRAGGVSAASGASPSPAEVTRDRVAA